MHTTSDATPKDVLLRVEHVVKHFPAGDARSRATVVHAVDDVSFELHRGETLGIVGETGCGKSTLARCITRLHTLTSGTVIFEGEDISTLSRPELTRVRRNMQMIFQDPFGSLNPRRRIGDIIAEPLVIHGIGSRDERTQRVRDMMDIVGLDPALDDRFPSQFSGGQRQRVGIARALMLRPSLLVCDEPVSALDVSIRAQILNLLADLQREFTLTYVFISHDLSVVRHLCDRVAVMYLGRIVEIAPSTELHAHPRHPYTAALLASVPSLDPDAAAPHQRASLGGEPPSPLNPPHGCRFQPRCLKAAVRCADEDPVLETTPADTASHRTACHFPVSDNEFAAIPERSYS